jgi:Kef-type K+ transport system membrane component KefB
LLLGPTLLDVLSWPILQQSNMARPGRIPRLIHDLAGVGVLLMFVAGLETDLVEMRRVGNVAFWSAFGGVALPMAGGAATAVAFGLPLVWKASSSEPSDRHQREHFGPGGWNWARSATARIPFSVPRSSTT